MERFRFAIVVGLVIAVSAAGYFWKMSRKDTCCPHDQKTSGGAHAGHEDEHHDDHAGHAGHEEHAEHADHDDHGNHEEHGHEHGHEGHADQEEGVIRLSAESVALGGIETAVVSQAPLSRMIQVNGRVTQDAETEDMTQVAAVFDIYESNFTDVRVGQTILVSALKDADHKHSGEITFVSSRVDPLANTLKARAVVNNADLDWKLGMFLRGEILLDSQGAAIAVPLRAVQTLEGGPVVFVRTADGEFEVRAIAIASENDGTVFVSHGLKEGEEIVVEGSFILKSKTMESEMEHGHSH